MEKIKLKKNENNLLINYNNHLKNYNFNKKNKIQNILFENSILLKKKDSYFLNINKNEIIIIPIENIHNKYNDNLLYTIKINYNDHLLFDYKFKYKFLCFFNKILFQSKKNKKYIKVFFIKCSKKKVLVSFLGLIFFIKIKQLNSNRKFFWEKELKKKYFKILNLYKYKKLYAKIITNKYKKKILSRKKYVKEIYSKIKKKKITKKQYYATI